MAWCPKKEDIFPAELKGQKIAVLVSSGVESSILLSLTGQYCAAVYPVYINSRTTWTNAELLYLPELLKSFSSPAIKPLKTLDMPVDDLYGSHWSLTGNNTPDELSTDEAVYLPGRNLLLLSKVSVWCALNDISAVVLGTLKSNPFSDTSSEFFGHIKKAIEVALNSRFNIYTPLSQLTKVQAIQLDKSLPWEKTFSCFNPVLQGDQFLHCGKCNKCAERQQAFIDTGLADKSNYSNLIAK